MASSSSSARTPAGPLGKRPLDDSTAQLGARKAPRLDVNDLLIALHSNATMLRSFDTSAFSGDNMKMLKETRQIISSLEYRVSRERERMRERPMAEVLLPQELLEHVLCFLSPRDLGIAMSACRSMKVAVEAAMQSKVRALGVRVLGGVGPMTARRLHQLTDQVGRAPLLVKKLTSANDDELQDFERGVIELHLDRFKAHIQRGLAGPISRREFGTKYGRAWYHVAMLAIFQGDAPVEWFIENIEMIIAAINADFDPAAKEEGNYAHSAISCFTTLPLDVVSTYLPRILPVLSPNRDGEALNEMLQYLSDALPFSILAANRATLLELLPTLFHYRCIEGYEIGVLARDMARRIAN